MGKRKESILEPAATAVAEIASVPAGFRSKGILKMKTRLRKPRCRNIPAQLFFQSFSLTARWFSSMLHRGFTDVTF